MNDLAPLLQGFFSDRLIRQRQASPHTIAAYRDAIILLLGFVHKQTGRQPATLSITDLDATTVAAFLAHLESDRGNSAATRNARLAAIHSLFRYAALRDPDHAALIQRVLAIPAKRTDRAIVGYLTREECDALIAAADQTSRLGRRDHALLHLAIHTGLRVSELTGLARGDVHLGTGPHVRCHGKGRRTAAPRSPDRPRNSSPAGSPSPLMTRTPLCFPAAVAVDSAATPCNAWLPNTPRPR